MSDFVAYVESKAGKPHCVVPPGGGVYSQEHGNRRTELICDDATLPAGTRVTVVLMNRPTSAEPGWYSQHGHVRLWLASPPDGKRMETEFVMGSHDGSIQAGRATPPNQLPGAPARHPHASHTASHDPQVDECLLPWCNGRLEKENALKPFKYAGEKASRL